MLWFYGLAIWLFWLIALRERKRINFFIFYNICPPRTSSAICGAAIALIYLKADLAHNYGNTSGSSSTKRRNLRTSFWFIVCLDASKLDSMLWHKKSACFRFISLIFKLANVWRSLLKVGQLQMVLAGKPFAPRIPPRRWTSWLFGAVININW